MKKLNFLKTIVDYTWFIMLISFPLILVFSTIMLVSGKPIGMDIKIIGTTVKPDSILGKLTLLSGLIYMAIILLSIFNLRKLLRNFQNLVIFEAENFILLKKIGQLIIIASILQITLDIIYQMSNDIVEINFGAGPFIYMLASGLFCVVLSEVFKIGRNLKEDHDLTI